MKKPATEYTRTGPRTLVLVYPLASVAAGAVPATTGVGGRLSSRPNVAATMPYPLVLNTHVEGVRCRGRWTGVPMDEGAKCRRSRLSIPLVSAFTERFFSP